MSDHIYVTVGLSEDTRRWLSRVLVTTMAPKDSDLDEMDAVVDWLITGARPDPVGPQDAP